jgi:riboflavin synthase alpha subunit
VIGVVAEGVSDISDVAHQETTTISAIKMEPNNCMDVVEGESASYSGSCVTSVDDGTEEVSIKVEKAIDVKDEIPQAIIFPPVRTEQEVMGW